MKKIALLFLCLLILLPVSAGVIADSNITVRVGVYENQPKVFTDESGKASGFWPDIIEYIASQEGWTIQYVHGTWTECLDRLKNGQIDIMMDVALTPERAQTHLFSDECPYTSWSRVYVHKGSAIESLPDLEGKTIAVMKGSINYTGPDGIKTLAESFNLDCTYLETDNYLGVFELIDNKQADAGVVSKDFAYSHEADYDIEPSAIVFQPAYLYFAFNKDAANSPYLKERIDYQVAQLKADRNSAYYKALFKWVGTKPIETKSIPVWLMWTFLSIIMVALSLTGGVAVFRREVKRKTRQLAAEIEEHRQAEIVLKAAEEKYRNTLDKMMEGCQIIDFGWHYIYLNNTAVVHSRRTREELLGHTMMEMYPGIEKTEMFQYIERCMKDRAPHTMENLFIYPDGSKAWFDFRMEPVAEGVSLFSVDKTERKNALEAIIETKGKLEAVFDSMTDAVIITDVHGDSVDFNDAFATYHRFLNKEDCSAKIDKFGEYIDFIYDDGTEVPFNMRPVPRALRGETAANVEYKTLRKDTGETWWGSVSFSPVRDKENRIIGAVIVARDITRRKKTEQALRDSENKFRQMILNLDEGYFSATLEGIILEHNQALNRILGYEKNIDLRGRELVDFWQDPEARKQYVNELYAHGSVSNYEVAARKQNGELITTLVSAHLEKDRENRPTRIEGVFLDVTEHRKAEKTLQENEAKLKEAQKMAHLGFWTLDVKTGAVEWSDEVFKIFHLDAEHFTPHIESILDMSPWPEDHQRDKEIIKKATESHLPGSYEQKFLRPDKSIGYYYSTFQGKYDEKGELTSIVGTVLDITERKHALQAITEAKGKLEAVFESMTDAILITDAQGKSFDFNDAFATYHRCLNKAECARKLDKYTEYIEFIYPDGMVVPADMQPMARVQRGEAANGIEYQLRRKDTGESWWGSYSFSPIRDKEGRISGSVVVAHDITQRKNADEVIRESEDKYRTLFNSMSEGFGLHQVILDADGKPADYRFLELNEAFEKLTGLSREKAIGKTVKEVLPGIETFWINAYGKVALTGQPIHFESFTEALGKWYEVYVYSPVKTQFATLFLDITQRKKAEEDLKASEDKFSRAFNSSPVGMAIIDSGSQRYVEVNEQWAKILEYTPEEILGHTSAELNFYTNPDIRDSIWKAFDEKNPVKSLEVNFRTKSGRIIQAVLSAETVILKGREYLVCTLMDITERRKMEKSLVESEEKLRSIFDSVPEGIIVTDNQGNIVGANRAAIAMYGYSDEEEITSKNGANLVVAEDREKLQLFTNELIEKEVVRNNEFTGLKKDGSRFPVEVSSSVLTDNDNKHIGFIVITSDITGRKKAQEEHRKMVEYQELDRLKTNLLSTISHELRTPLASIKGYASLLLMYDRKLKKTQKTESLEAIDRSTDRLAELIDRLLDMSRLDAGLLKLTLLPVDPNEITNIAVNEAKLRSPDFDFRNEAGDRLPEIMADSKRLRQILDNLLENAVKYSPPKTVITVKTEVKPEGLQISITDQGRGIAEAEFTKIFERMYRIEQRLQKDPGGLGLGLSLCKALVEAHGGRIWVESVIDKGSTFYFTIPLKHEAKVIKNDKKNKTHA